MISSDFIRGYIDLMVLSTLQDEPNYGYGIAKAIDTITKEDYSVKQTTLYSAFKRLERNGYVTSFTHTQDNGKERTYYRLTEDGTSYFADMCDEWRITQEIINRFVPATTPTP